MLDLFFCETFGLPFATPEVTTSDGLKTDSEPGKHWAGLETGWRQCHCFFFRYRYFLSFFFPVRYFLGVFWVFSGIPGSFLLGGGKDYRLF